ncbi:MAG TPA: 2-iminoacetate synthase ThiH [Candidatus Omnitrophica bacterium]|nr:2-iminoacetate synthase ThiH [Candidatus Omnitrophota bacterium]
MGFYDSLEKFEGFDLESFFKKVSDDDILRAINNTSIDELDLLSLLSPQAGRHLEAMAQKSQELTLRNFGRVIYLYAPLYLGNFCDNECLYCGFKRDNPIERRKLSLPEVEKEAEAIAATGIRHILILTGESRQQTPVSYLKDCVLALKNYFSSISIEVYPLEAGEYKELIDVGVDGLTLYQETYDRSLYRQLHPRGPKSDFLYRLDAPDRAAGMKMRSLSIGALLGLADFRREAFFLGLHASYMEHRYPEVELSVSLPRFQRAAGDFSPVFPVGEAEFVQIMTALRLFLPRAGINISTREGHALRANLIGLGVTRMSAGSRTEVGGYALDGKTEGQFEVADKCGVSEVKEMIVKRGYQPVLKDWQAI